MIEIYNKNNNKSSELEYEYIKRLEDDVAKQSREYIFLMPYDQLKNVTGLLMEIGDFYSENNERKQARNNYIKALDYCEYAVAEDENDEILTYYLEICEFLLMSFRLTTGVNANAYERAVVVNHFLIESTEENDCLSSLLRKLINLGNCCYKRKIRKEACLIYKNAVFAGRKLMLLYPRSANEDNLARACFGYAQTVDDSREQLRYAKKAYKIFDDLMRADFFQCEHYEQEKQYVEDFLKSIFTA